jgi:hypothetical protein
MALFTPLVDDDGTGTVGTILNNAWLAAIDAALVVQFNALNFTQAPYSVTDASGAGLVFTGVTGRYAKVGPLFEASVGLIYPATASGLQAAVFLPIVESTVPGAGVVLYSNSGLAMTAAWTAATQVLAFYTLAGGSVTNASLSGKSLSLFVFGFNY